MKIMGYHCLQICFFQNHKIFLTKFSKNLPLEWLKICFFPLQVNPYNFFSGCIWKVNIHKEICLHTNAFSSIFHLNCKKFYWYQIWIVIHFMRGIEDRSVKHNSLIIAIFLYVLLNLPSIQTTLSVSCKIN